MDEEPSLPKVREGVFNESQLQKFSEHFYNIYYFPNTPSDYTEGTNVNGSQIDTFSSIFCDMDLKDKTYTTKEEFINVVHEFGLPPTKIVDSGNGVHVYWTILDLDALTFLKLQRRLCRYFKTDEAVSKVCQLMRVPGTINTKNPDDLKICEVLAENNNQYTCEEIDSLLPILSQADESYCRNHLASSYDIKLESDEESYKLPPSFGKLLRDNAEVKDIYTSTRVDRSKSDFRLGHLMFSSSISKEDATQVLKNTAKALSRAPKYRQSYAENIVDQIWTFDVQCPDNSPSNKKGLSVSVRDILSRVGQDIKGTRFACYKWLDNTDNGFRLGQVIGLIAGSGVGKTAVALNMFMGFVTSNPDYDHFFVSLEQPANEIADRWKTMCGDNTSLYDKVHIISNYGEDDMFRNLSLTEIKDYLLSFKQETGRKVGCVVVDHIGALKKQGKDGENQGLIDICHNMKSFAIETNTLMVMQSQAPREKAGIGDLELDKDAAYGTMFFEAYCDYVVTMWQPLKRAYSDPACPTVTALKFCKIRHKKRGKDVIQEDTRYALIFDPLTEKLRQMNEIEEKAFDHFNQKALNLRNLDKKTDLLVYTSLKTKETQPNDTAT